jgi:hypothetical protein
MDRNEWLKNYQLIAEDPTHEDFDLVWRIYDTNNKRYMEAYDNYKVSDDYV